MLTYTFPYFKKGQKSDVISDLTSFLTGKKNKISETFPQFFLSNKYQSIEEEDEIPFSNSVKMNCTDMHNEIRKDVGTWQIWQAL